MSKWSIYLNKTRFCQSQRGTGNRPCDMGMMCDRCHYDHDLQEGFKEEEPTIDEELYCKGCSHKLKLHEEGYCDCCREEIELV